MLCYDYASLPNLVKEYILPLLEKYKILTFSGPLGVGKTALVKEILKQCGVRDVVDSPSFGYVKGYVGGSGRIFNHFDLYRLSSVDDFVGAGFDEYLYRENECCLIEWPDVIKPLLCADELSCSVINIELRYDPNNAFEGRFIIF